MRRPWSARAKRRLLRAGIVLARHPRGHGPRRPPSASRTARPRRSTTFPADVPTPTPATGHRRARSCGSSSIGETDAFVRTAVRRHNLDASWPLIHPNLKQGTVEEGVAHRGDPRRSRSRPTGSSPGTSTGPMRTTSRPTSCSSPSRRAASTGRRSRSSSSGSGSAENNRWLVYSWVPNGVSEALIDNEHEAESRRRSQNVHGHQGLSVVGADPVGASCRLHAAARALPRRAPALAAGRRRTRPRLAARQTLELEPVVGSLDAVGHRELGRPVREEHPAGARGASPRPSPRPRSDARAAGRRRRRASRVASQTKRSVSRASSTSRSLGPLSPE